MWTVVTISKYNKNLTGFMLLNDGMKLVAFASNSSSSTKIRSTFGLKYIAAVAAAVLMPGVFISISTRNPAMNEPNVSVH